MAKFFIFFMVLFIIASDAFGQENSQLFYKKFGVLAGINFAHMNFNKGVPPPPTPVNTDWHLGVFVGFLLQVPLTGKLYIQPQYIYSQLGGEVSASKTVYKLNYLSMPVYLKYQFTRQFSVFAGPQLDLLINAKVDSFGKSYNITHDTEERNFGLSVGLEFKILKHLGLNARYMQGLNHVGIGQRSNVSEFKFELLQFCASFYF